VGLDPKFADELAAQIGALDRSVMRASTDRFHRPVVERYRLGRSSPEHPYRDSYDCDSLRSDLMDTAS
jgi:uridine kinase